MKRALALLIALASAGATAPTAAQSLTGQYATLPTVLRALTIVCHRTIVGDPQLASMHVTGQIPLNNCEQALDLLQRFYGLHIEQMGSYTIVSSANAGRVKIRVQLSNASADTVGKALQNTSLMGQNLVVFTDVRTNSIDLVGSPEYVETAKALIADADVPDSGVHGPETSELHVLNGDVNQETQLLSKLYNGAYGPLTISAYLPRSAIMVSGSPAAVHAAQSMMPIVDAPVWNIVLHVRVVELIPNNDETNLGTIFGGVSPNSGGSGNVSVTPNQLFWPFTSRSIPVNVTINTLISHGEAQILADPDITVRNGSVAGPLHIGQTQPIVTNNGGLIGGQTVTTLDTGVTLTATPVASANHVVHIELNFGYSQVAGYLNGYPILNSRSLPTTIDVAEGETVSFGGLTEDTTTKTDDKFPVLGDIPIFGRLFHNISTSHVKDSIVFMITPEIKPLPHGKEIQK